MGNEDQRTAVAMQVSLSNSLVTAALTVLGAQAVIVTFVLDKRTDLSVFYAVSSVGAVMLVSSMVVGGKGIAEAYKSGFAGTWRSASSGQFQFQTILALVGVFAVGVSTFCGTAQPPDSAILSTMLERLQKMELATTADRQSIARLEGEVRQLRTSVQKVERPAKRRTRR